MNDGERDGSEQGKSRDGSEAGTSLSALAQMPPPPAERPTRGRATAPSGDGATEPAEPKPIPARWLAAAALGAVGMDIGLRRPPWNNLAGSLLFLTVIAALWMTGAVRTRNAKLLLVLAGLLAICLSWRSDPLLSAFNFCAAMGLIALAGFHGRGRSLWTWTPMQAIDDGIHVAAQAFETIFVEVPSQLSLRVRGQLRDRRPSDATSTNAVLRGVALAVPILLVFGLLLASADAAFESIFSSLGFMSAGFNLGPLGGHIALLALGAVTTLAILRVVVTAPEAETRDRMFTVGSIESTIVLVGVNVLFALFAAAQLFTVVGGADAALERAGVDPKEFARQGFFQLLWVAALTLMLLMALRSSRDPHDGREQRFQLLAMVTVALTLLIVVVALTRLSFYIGDEGQTPLRFYSSVFSLWIALCLGIVSARILGWRADITWLTSALVVAASVVGLVLNVINPEAIMARDNLAKDHEHLVFHLRPEHRQFSGEGWAVIADGLGELSGPIAADVQFQLCREHGLDTYNDGLFDFNVGKWRGDRALTDLCGERAAGLFE